MKNLTRMLFFIILSNSYAQAIIITQSKMSENIEIATLANGCFWCTEAIFQQLNGVLKVTSGYSGGATINPSYEEICTGRTGHAEAIQIKFDSEIVSFQEILDVFFSTHDPTTLNRQGNDVGTQYRSAIFYHSSNQKIIAEDFIEALTEAQVFNNPIVTQLTEFNHFYKAEDYHQNYYNTNKNQAYCKFVIQPKLEKFIKNYASKIKE